ncbi:MULTISPECIES: fimbrial protein [Providencia]|uniref:fimbrial protein n=1 Tax=Providencia TaxID=586 RepID=UPI000837BE10|nr:MULTISPECIES: fimbrial protein [Providencia]MBP6120839.1 type 1 fimbrial protein [Providencia sp.]NIH23298.1 type 1 fimbrial protein [Providencia heimbachae]
MTSRAHHRLYQGCIASLFCLAAVLPAIADNNDHIFRPTDGWEVDGQHGVIHVSGALTENPCRLAMDSSNQSVSLGNISFANLNQSTGWGRQVPFQIELLDCLEVQTELQNFQMGQSVWSTTQPAVKVRFIAPTVPQYTDIIRVNGIQGLGLQVMNVAGQVLPIGKDSNPMLIASGQNRLTYYVTAVRTSGPLIPGAFSALIAFEMLYD